MERVDEPNPDEVTAKVGSAPLGEGPARSAAWKWLVCGLLFLATMIMYMDRQTLSFTIKRIKNELHLSSEQYGRVEKGFGLAFAVGALGIGILADRVSIRWLYPLVLIGWSLAGIATAYGQAIGGHLLDFFPWLIDPAVPTADRQTLEAYWGIMVCRVVLGFFEAGHWPCALITTQRLLSREDRSLGNSVLQSGASIGAVLTPAIVWLLLTDQPGSWRSPFVIVGIAGMLWVLPWLGMMGASRELAGANHDDSTNAGPSFWVSLQELLAADRLRMLAILLAVVIPINITWQYFRAWMPLLLQEEHGVSEARTFWFGVAFYLVADVGCLAVGAAVKLLTLRGWSTHAARAATFFACSALTSLSVVAAYLPRNSPATALPLLLFISFGALGLFPTFYALTQDVSKRHQGLVTGLLGFSTWVITSYMQEWFGKQIDATKSYADGLIWAGLVPLAACVRCSSGGGRRSGSRDDGRQARAHPRSRHQRRGRGGSWRSMA
jgi:ACS family hexuronate transporter-like MFS transporter